MKIRLARLWRAHPDLLTVAVVLAAVLITRLPSLGNRLSEVHAFRQTQTAWASLLFAQQGIDLLRPQVPVFGPPFAMPLEFPLFQAAASLFISAGLGPDFADRLMGLLCFLVSSVAVYRLGLRLAGRFVAAIALFAFTFSPFALLWSRASLIDFLAVALSLWYLEASLAALTGRSRQRWWLATLAAVLGGLALMVKITIGVFWLLPVAVVLSTYWRGWKNRRVALLMSALLLVLPMAGGALWFEISREVRQQNLYAYALNDQTGLAWYFGDLAERLNISDWVNILGRVLAEIGGLLLPIVLILGWRERRELPERWQRATWTGLAILAIAAPLILFNVYAIHDYYLAAIAPVIALYFGLGARYLYRHRERMWTRMLAGGLASAWMFVMLASFNFGLAAVDLSLIMSLSLVMLVLWAGLRQRGAQLRIALLSSALLLYFLAFGTVIAMDLLGGSNYLRQVYFPPPDAHAQASAQIEALVPVDHWAALIVPDRDYNMQWDPSYFYYAHREGLMIGSVVRSLGGLRVACADPRYVLLTLSADQQVSRASCPDGAPIP